MKKERGITLISLVITIIVLLILAGVSISLVVGNNGVLTQSKNAVEKNRKSTAKEVVEIAWASAETDYLSEKASNASLVKNADFFDNKLKTYLSSTGHDISVENGNVEGTYKIKYTSNDQNIPYTFIVSSNGNIEKEKTIEEYPIVTASTNNSPVTENSKYLSDGKIAIIPKGYALSNEISEQSIDSGLVIKKDGNEWVWIPVNSNDLALMYTEDNTGWVMHGTSGNNAVITKYKSNSRTDIDTNLIRGNPGVMSRDAAEPNTGIGYNGQFLDVKEENRKAAGFVESDGITASSLENMATKLRDDYMKMIESLKKYGGFYVGRYELSSVGTKRNQNTTLIKTWYEVYAMCKEIDNSNTSVETRMIWGCQWDQVCSFIATYKDGNEIKTRSLNDSRTYGNYNDSQAPANTGNYSKGNKKNTGSNEAWKTNNIYDLAGNNSEWTQERTGYGCPLYRSGWMNSSGSSASVVTRWESSSPDSSDKYFGFSSRPVLYLN